MTPMDKHMADIGLVALRHGLTRWDIVGESRTVKVVKARRDCARMFRERGYSYQRIGRIMQRDHSSIINLLKPKCNPGVPGASAGLI